MVNIVGLYQSLLLDASYSGIPFGMIDSREEVGRRVLRFLFPAIDAPAFQDLGQTDGEISVAGLLVGDDYVEQAATLRAAFLTPGPATLQHPWLGHVQVMLAPGRGPTFSWRQDELRVTRFHATFLRYAPEQPTVLDTLGRLYAALDSLRAQADALLAAILAPVALTIAAIGAVESFAGDMVAEWTSAVGAITSIPSAITGAISGLVGVIGLPLDTTYAGAVGTALAGPSAAIAAGAAPVLPAAVAPSGSTTPPVALDPRACTTAILAGIASMAATAPAAGAVSLATIGLAAQALALADAIATASNIPFDSQQEAMQWGAQLRAALSAAATSAAAGLAGSKSKPYR
jgi:prophage DNA circulation protein